MAKDDVSRRIEKIKKDFQKEIASQPAKTDQRSQNNQQTVNNNNAVQEAIDKVVNQKKSSQ
jgi:hypothetical protein